MWALLYVPASLFSALIYKLVFSLFQFPSETFCLLPHHPQRITYILPADREQIFRFFNKQSQEAESMHNNEPICTWVCGSAAHRVIFISLRQLRPSLDRKGNGKVGEGSTHPIQTRTDAIGVP
jgi:hypothetical protein